MIKYQYILEQASKQLNLIKLFSPFLAQGKFYGAVPSQF